MLNAVSAQTPYLHALMPNPHRAIERILRLYIRLALRRKTTGAPRRRAIQLNGIQPQASARQRVQPRIDIMAPRCQSAHSSAASMPSLRSDSVSTAGSSASSEVVDECAKAKPAASAETEAEYSTTAPCGSAAAMCAAQVFGASGCLDGRCPAKTASVSAVQTASGLANSAPLTAPSGNALIPMRSI